VSGSPLLPVPFGWQPSPPDWSGPRLDSHTLSSQFNLSKALASSESYRRAFAAPETLSAAAADVVGFERGATGWRKPIAFLNPGPRNLHPGPGPTRLEIEARPYGETFEGGLSRWGGRTSALATGAGVMAAWLRARNHDSGVTWGSALAQTGLGLGTEFGPPLLERLGLIGARTAGRAGAVITGAMYVAGVGMAYDQGMRERGWNRTPARRHGGHPVPGRWVGGTGRPGPEVLAAPIVTTWDDLKYLWEVLSAPLPPRQGARGGRPFMETDSALIPSDLQQHLAEWEPRLKADAEAARNAKGNAAVWARLQVVIDLQGYWGCTAATRRLYVAALADELATIIHRRGPRMMRPGKEELRKAIRSYLLWTSGLSLSRRSPWQRVPEAQRDYLALAGLLPRKLVHDPRWNRATMTPAERRRMILARHGVSSMPTPSAPATTGSGTYSGSSASAPSSSASSSSTSVRPWERYGMTKAQWLAWVASKKGR
jgi:hypothetical protein